jgi:hypothetical protein
MSNKCAYTLYSPGASQDDVGLRYRTTVTLLCCKGGIHMELGCFPFTSEEDEIITKLALVSVIENNFSGCIREK